MLMKLRRGRGEISAKLSGKDKAVPVLFLTEHHTMRAYWGVDV
jgi:hypothetical protein